MTSTAFGNKISVSWDDLNSENVEQKLKRQDALQQVRSHYQKRVATVAAVRGAWRYRTWVYMALFGLAGGVLAWCGAELVNLFQPDRTLEIRMVQVREQQILQQVEAGRITELEKATRLQKLYSIYKDNGFVRVLGDWTLDAPARKQQLIDQWNRYQKQQQVRHVIWHVVVAMFIALALGVGDNLMSRNWRTASITGGVALLLGAVGGVLVSLFDSHIYAALGGDTPGVSLARQMLARSVGWGILGLFLCIAPGIVLRSGRRMAIDVAGGFLGGLLGGMLFDPISIVVGNGLLSRLIAITAIGALAGAGTGLIETVAKTGWLKVDKGLIAGKQFILYRNPTFIGSSPQCEIYLFNDPMISGQHAAIHLLGDGFEIENLDASARTQVNRQDVARTRVRNGDKIQIGATRIIFQEKGSVPRCLR